MKRVIATLFLIVMFIILSPFILLACLGYLMVALIVWAIDAAVGGR
jgi:hypothetical protein